MIDFEVDAADCHQHYDFDGRVLLLLLVILVAAAAGSLLGLVASRLL